jgi:hypothetical protein
MRVLLRFSVSCSYLLGSRQSTLQQDNSAQHHKGTVSSAGDAGHDVFQPYKIDTTCTHAAAHMALPNWGKKVARVLPVVPTLS